jgi:hypothetical protein
MMPRIVTTANSSNNENPRRRGRLLCERTFILITLSNWEPK